jgi:H+/Cl- antiporter ClcA
MSSTEGEDRAHTSTSQTAGRAPAAQNLAEIVASRQFIMLLLLAGVVGLVASFAAWCFLEAVHQLQVLVFTDLTGELGYQETPVWWPLPVLGIAGLIVAFAIVRLPGGGGHVPAEGLSTAPIQPEALPGVIIAALATIGLGLVLGPEAPLIALGGGLGTLVARMVRADAPSEMVEVLSAGGVFAALALIFGNPLIAAVIVIEVTGLGGPRLPLVLLPGLLAAGIGSLLSIGMGSWTGLSASAYALDPLSLPEFHRPDLVDFAWTIPFAVLVASGAFAITRSAQVLYGVVKLRPLILVPAAALAVAALAIVFSESTNKGIDEVLFDGQEALPGLVSGANTWSIGTLALLILIKGVAWSISLASFRGGPVFPSIFLGAAAGIMASHIPGYALTPAVSVGVGAAVGSVLGLPLSGVVLAVLLTSQAGLGASPLVIVGVVVAYVTTTSLSRLQIARAQVPGLPVASRS